MILSHKNRFIFLKTSKTAGTSLEIALSKYCGPDDVITPIQLDDEAVRASLGYPGPQNYLKRRRQYTPRDHFRLMRGRKAPRTFYNHIPARDVRARVGKAIWESYLKVSIVRNPFDYVVSRYFWAHEGQEVSRTGFREYLMSKPKVLHKNRRITHIDGTKAVDFMIRFEHFGDDLTELAERVGLPRDLHAEFSALGAKKGVRPPHATTDEMFSGFSEGIELVCAIYEEDIAEYGYAVPSG